MTNAIGIDRTAAVRLMAELRDRGLPPAKIAAALTISPITAYRWASGQTEPKYSEGLWLQQKLTEATLVQQATQFGGDLQK